jgi:2-polyprenyl-3-methyl-5-hydroxy-6-metoxy-1,4-benzoquinol methylase
MEGVKQDGYYNYERRDMLEFVPAQARTILDVGCASGAFGQVLKKAKNMEVWGVEMNEEAARSASEKLDRVLTGDVARVMTSIPEEYFDCVVFNDVLEHLVDPYSVLLSVKSKLRKDGVVVCSLPNIRYYRQLRELLVHKQWRYEDAGILDRTHLRFFTERSIKDMFRDLDFDIVLFRGMNAMRSRNLKLLNALLFGALSDARYAKFACVVKPKQGEKPRKDL